MGNCQLLPWRQLVGRGQVVGVDQALYRHAEQLGDAVHSVAGNRNVKLIARLNIGRKDVGRSTGIGRTPAAVIGAAGEQQSREQATGDAAYPHPLARSAGSPGSSGTNRTSHSFSV